MRAIVTVAAITSTLKTIRRPEVDPAYIEAYLRRAHGPLPELDAKSFPALVGAVLVEYDADDSTKRGQLRRRYGLP